MCRNNISKLTLFKKVRLINPKLQVRLITPPDATIPRGFTSTEDYLKRAVRTMYSKSSKKCSAHPKCLGPEHEEQQMIRCDECSTWYHLLCIGFNSENSRLDLTGEDYICKKCTDLMN